METARQWASQFFKWDNHEHYHSGLNLLTPASVHPGEAVAVTYVEALNRQHFDEGVFHALSEGSVARAYYFGNRLLSIELIGSQNMLYPYRQTDSPPLGQAFVFDATDLAANRMGNLSEAQRQRFSAEMHSPDRACLLIVLLLAAVPASIAVVALLTNETESLQSEAEANPVLPMMLIGFSIVVAALALWLAISAIRTRVALRTGSFAYGTVRAIEGVVRKKEYSAGDAETLASYRVLVGSTWIDLRPSTYEVIEEGRAYRFYRYKWTVVSAEPL
jgi:hypothetical protein